MEDEYNPEDHEESVYSEQGREDSVEGGEISPEEDAFMAGYEEAEEGDGFDDEEESDEDKN